MRMRIDRDEGWPVYEPSHDERFGREVEVPDGFDKKYRRVAKQWAEVQNVLHEAWLAADG